MDAWISLDNIKPGNIGMYVGNLQDMKSAGLLERVLISHDSGWYTAGEENGGTFSGYTTIFRELIPALRQGGFTEPEIQQLLITNPANAFKINKTQ
jgi:phosphotriesterase-related protein